MKGEGLRVKGSAHAGGYSEGGGDGGKYGDDAVEYLAPSVFVFHDVCVFFVFFTTEDTESHRVFILPSARKI